MDERFRDIELSKIEINEFRSALASAFRTDVDAWPLLHQIDYPPQRFPTFTGRQRNAWYDVFNDLENGITHTPYRGLLAAALRERPANRVFVRLSDAHGVTTADLTQAAPPEARGDPRRGTFICHSSGDKKKVQDLYRRLAADRVECWLDQESLLPGQDFDREIRRALRRSRFVVVCLSSASVDKVGYIQRELRYALDLAEEQPEGTIFLIVVRLEPCKVPDRLAHLHHVDLFAPAGYDNLLRVLRSADDG